MNATNPATDLATIEKLALEKLAKSAGKSDLDDLLKGARRSLLLVDCSGSMGEPISAGGTKMTALRSVVAELRESNPVPVAGFGLSGRAQVGIVDSIPDPSGQTPMHLAIDFGAAEGANHLVIVTDGQPDSEGATFEAARRFGGPIDVFYVGDGWDRGASFAKELAAMTGGTANLADLSKPKALRAGIAGLLGDGSL